MMRDFIRDGLLHWQCNGESPCGTKPWPELGNETTLFGWRPPHESEAGDCPRCIPIRRAAFRFFANGGTWAGPWNIKPNGARP